MTDAGEVGDGGKTARASLDDNARNRRTGALLRLLVPVVESPNMLAVPTTCLALPRAARAVAARYDRRLDFENLHAMVPADSEHLPNI